MFAWVLCRGESTTERNSFYFHEQYKSKAGFTAHTEAPHFKVGLRAGLFELGDRDPHPEEALMLLLCLLSPGVGSIRVNGPFHETA